MTIGEDKNCYHKSRQKAADDAAAGMKREGTISSPAIRGRETAAKRGGASENWETTFCGAAETAYIKFTPFFPDLYCIAGRAMI